MIVTEQVNSVNNLSNFDGDLEPLRSPENGQQVICIHG